MFGWGTQEETNTVWVMRVSTMNMMISIGNFHLQKWVTLIHPHSLTISLKTQAGKGLPILVISKEIPRCFTLFLKIQHFGTNGSTV